MTAKVEEALRFISKFALLNVVWIGFSVAGLVVFGLFPATYALFVTARQWVRSGNEVPVVKPFLTIYKANFIRSNVCGWLLLSAGALLYMNYQVISQSEGAVPFPVVVAFLFVVSLYLLVLVTVVPVSVHFQEQGVMQTLASTLRFIFGRLHIALLFGVILWGGIYLSLAFPAVIVFFSGSVLAYMLMWFFDRSMEKIQVQQHA
ncbi:YesL family protein [Alkalicoccus halolimnae]|uniref:DUF624 domain-containing protein n=1 Tax=Alkalicoccus halolimnae TaxID=1667239 RepID=A0AAJ8N2Z7_9BACI|nr:DUF624 domain-containing protein [Alkalicoccus halolimnae]